ncbi:hypothetical protein JD844_007964 [Phrynosoma platyrhinos]|uniref:Uncharacterized protein n=1 Tax=Phrynosoma platyrhinos TaxID=52577 RepID=A0ABQ7T3Y8_PHRPL|nr:hypothetical protein JD844_007964 [Phrynosoma platyrhinos]
MEHQIEEEAHRLVEAFSQAKGQPLDPSLLISNAISTLISVVSFGYRFSQEDEMFQKLMEAIDVLARFGVSFSHVVYNFFPRLMKYLPGPHKKALSCMEMALSFAKQEIKKHKERQDLQEPQDFIDFYLLQMEKVKRAYKEMEDVLGSSHSICYEDRKKLPYTNAVIHEVQRAKYILPVGVPRRCSKELNMLGFHIPRVQNINMVAIP